MQAQCALKLGFVDPPGNVINSGRASFAIVGWFGARDDNIYPVHGVPEKQGNW